MREVGVRLKLATEFCQFSGTAKAFRELLGEKSKSADQYHRMYRPDDIRYARLKMLGLDADDLTTTGALPPLIVVRMAKGGTGKTTIAGNVASALAMMGYKICLIDGDPQASLTGIFGIDWSTEEITHIGNLMYQYSRGRPVDLEKAIRPLYEGNMLDLIASDITLADTDSWLMGVTNREALFKRLLESQSQYLSRYDAIILDSAPSTTLLTNTFMVACKKLLAVVWLDGQSLKAMTVLASNVAELNHAFQDQGFNLDVHIVANGYHPSYQPCRDALSTLAAAYASKLNDNIIPHSTAFMRQIDLIRDEKSGPVLEREPNSVAARSIIDLTKSLIREYDIRLANIAPSF